MLTPFPHLNSDSLSFVKLGIVLAAIKTIITNTQMSLARPDDLYEIQPQFVAVDPDPHSKTTSVLAVLF